jgi:transglutaminase-like putative cysteine protease
MGIRYKLGCSLNYEIVTPTVLIFNLQVAKLHRHIDLVESLTITPDQDVSEHTTPIINNRYFGIHAQPGPLTVHYNAEVTLEPHSAPAETVNETPVQHLPLDIMPFLLPSRFVPSDRLAAFAHREFGYITPGYSRVASICNWIYANIDYRRGSSTEQTIATDSLLIRAGVCRDFAHLGIAFCRALEIPARYVSCYAFGLEPADFHAVFEAYLDGRWWLFDATRQAHLDGLIRIGVGRDAAEIAFCSPFGGQVDYGPIDIRIDRLEPGKSTAWRTTDAISTEEPTPNAGAA